MTVKRKRRGSSRVADKLAKVAAGKTPLGRVNEAIDALDALSPNKSVDTGLHVASEVVLGKGSLRERAKKSVKKTIKYRI